VTDADFKTIATVWAAIEPLSGRELLYAQQIQPDSVTNIIIRYFTGLSSKDRFLHVDRKTNVKRRYNIENISDTEELHEQMVCKCHEVTT
jgi:SPP1 family predicted phage head-tail adaptor